MQTMHSAPVIRIEGARKRGRRVAAAVDARRRLDNRPREARRTRGRAWLNGIELGDPTGAFAHLARSYD
jgi:hypothetical protein